MSLEQRNIEVRLVRNVKDFVDNDQFEQANVIELETRLNRLKDAWRSFVVHHSVLMGQANDDAVKAEHERVFDQMDQDCIILETQLKSRIEIVQQVEMRARAAERERQNQENDTDVDSEPEGNRSNVRNNERQYHENDENELNQGAEEQSQHQA